MDNNFVSHESHETDNEIINKILEGISTVEEYVEVKLPSLATNLYGTSTDTVSLRAITFEDEKIIANMKDKTKIMDVLLGRCLKEDIDPKDLIPHDKIYLLMHLRQLSVGNTHKISITCSKCDKKSEVELNVLETFPCNYPEEPLTKTKEFVLPILQKPVVVRRASSHELDSLGTAGLLNDLWRFVLSIDGHTNAKVRSQVVNKLPRKDIREIIKVISSDEIGLDTKFMFACISCKHEELTEFSFQDGFFTMI